MSLLLHTPDGLRPWARRLARWLLLALLLATLAPGISRALPVEGPPDASPGEHWVELCTSVGMQWVRVDLENPVGPDAPDPGSLDRCGHCTLAAERFAPLSPSLPVLPPALGEPVAPPPLAVLFTVFSAPVPGARGPPLLG
jgi:hypothetical protein